MHADKQQPLSNQNTVGHNSERREVPDETHIQLGVHLIEEYGWPIEK